MEPTQKSVGPKRHPLQFTTKPKETKEVEKPKIQKEKVLVQRTQIIDSKQKNNVDVLSSNQEKIEEKAQILSTVVDKNTVDLVKNEPPLLQSPQTNSKVEDISNNSTRVSADILSELKQQKKQIKQVHLTNDIKKIENQNTNTKIQTTQNVKNQLTKIQNQRGIQDQNNAKEKHQQKLKKSQNYIYLNQQIGQKKQKLVPQKHPITISIKQSSQKGSGLFKYTMYTITGQDKHGPFDISRKQEQFVALSNILHQRWPGCFIPAVTQQIQLKNATYKQKHKRNTLANFLIGLSYSSHLYYREQVQLFLRSPDINVIQMFSQMPALKTKDVISRFKSSFGDNIQVNTPDNEALIKKFTAALRKIINNLTFLSKKALSLAQAYETYALHMVNFGKIQKAYEQFSLVEYSSINKQKFIVIKDNQNKIDRLQQMSKSNPFYKLYSHLNNQIGDAEAFIEIIIASQLFVLKKDDYQRQIKQVKADIESLMLGHKSIKIIASRKSKEQVQTQLQQKHKKLVQAKDSMVEMFNILQNLLATKQIELYKLFKRNSFRFIMQEWVNFSSSTLPQIQAVWQFIGEEAKQQFR